MNPDQIAAQHALEMAQQARKAGDKTLARQYAEQAANLAPELEEVWLMMAALASPRASIVFLERALAINPQSDRARQGMHWAVDRLRRDTQRNPGSAKAVVYPAKTAARNSAVRTRYSYAAVVLMAACLVVFGAVWVTPAAASFINSSIFTSSQNKPAWAPVDVVKPTYTLAASVTPAPSETMIPTASPTATATLPDLPTDTATLAPTDTPTETPTEFPSATPADALDGADAVASPTALPTDTPGPVPTLAPTNASSAPQATPVVPLPASSGNGNGGARWIDVDLTNQMVYAYQGNAVVNSFLVSTGTWQFPTVTGKYHIYVKYRYANMSGPGYYLPNVPFTMYFYKGYGLHGTYWHHNFGHPMSHGCVNLSIPDAGWLYDFASVGTLVNIHY